MAQNDQAAGPVGPPHTVQDYFGFARAHADTADTRDQISDLEDMLRVAWNLMTPEQQDAFRSHADILAIAESGGGGSAAA